MADTIAPLANLIGGEFGVQGALSQDASGNWLLSNTSNEGTTTSSLLQNDLTSDQWAQFQQLLSKGYLDTSTMQGRALLSNNAPSIGGLAPSQQFGLANMGSGYVSLGNNENTGPPSMYGGRQLTDPSMVKWDPNYGWITPQANVKSDDDWIDKVGSFVGDIAPGAIMAALSAGFGALGAPVWATMLTNLASSLGGSGGPPLTLGSGAGSQSNLESQITTAGTAASAGSPQVTGVPAGMEQYVPLLLLLNQAFGASSQASNKNQSTATNTSGGNANNLPVVNNGLFTSSPTSGRLGVQ
jgi:hypothetical protein